MRKLQDSNPTFLNFAIKILTWNLNLGSPKILFLFRSW